MGRSKVKTMVHDVEPWVSMREVAEALHLSYEFVRQLAIDDKIPYFCKPTAKYKTRLFKVSQVDAALASMQSKTA